MAFSAGLYLTNVGRMVLAAAQTGTQLYFTRLEMGDGQLSGQLEVDRTALISPKQSLDLTVLRINSDGTATVGAAFHSSTVGSFLWRELGLWVRDPNNPAAEILYGYANAGSGAQAIPEAGSAEIVEKTISIVITSANASNVSASVASGIYADAALLNDHLSDTDNPHNVTLDQIGGAPLVSPAFAGTPTAPTPSVEDNSTRLATTAYIAARIAALVSSSPAALDTLQELAAALGNDANFSTTVTNLIATKYAKPLRFIDTNVTTSGWNSDATYADFPYRKAVALTGATAAMLPDVVLAPSDATGGNIAPVSVAYAGGIYLYAKSAPTASFVIPTITLWAGV